MQQKTVKITFFFFFLAEWIHIRGKLLDPDPHEGSESRRQKMPKKCQFTQSLMVVRKSFFLTLKCPKLPLLRVISNLEKDNEECSKLEARGVTSNTQCFSCQGETEFCTGFMIKSFFLKIPLNTFKLVN